MEPPAPETLGAGQLLGLSGWTANDWTSGSSLAQLAPPAKPSRYLATQVAASFRANPAQTLAEVAAMSPYHWHRIYHAMRGETAVATAKRLRLQRASVELAQTNATMAIFLGKQYLGQADRRELESSAQSAEDAFAVDAQQVRDKLAAILADRDPEADRGAGGDAE